MGFGPPTTPQVIKNLMIANGVVFLLQLVVPAVTVFGTVSPVDVWLGFEFWRPFTYMWLHSPGSIFHIAFNMFSLWMFGSPLALFWGEQRFLRYFLVCGVGAGFLIATVPLIPVLMGLMPVGAGLGMPTLGASGAVMGVVLAYTFTWPDRTLMLLFPPMPIKAIWLIPVILVIEFTSGPSNVSHIGHLGGLLVGWIYLIREGRTPGAPTLDNLKHRWRRYRMRQRIRALHEEDRRERSERFRDDDDRPRYH
ncbi:MAG TPA: rhomboid family intramembrane serine protease [Planctomycetota bacterium]|nr:rhomboid family intramembrane serine protease [Planctomycetota bacterium]